MRGRPAGQRLSYPHAGRRHCQIDPPVSSPIPDPFNQGRANPAKQQANQNISEQTRQFHSSPCVQHGKEASIRRRQESPALLFTLAHIAVCPLLFPAVRALNGQTGNACNSLSWPVLNAGFSSDYKGKYAGGQAPLEKVYPAAKRLSKRTSARLPALPRRLVENDGAGGGNIERFGRGGHWDCYCRRFFPHR